MVSSPNTKRFTFVNLSAGVRTKGVNHGIAALVPLLRRCGWDAALINITEEVPPHRFLEEIRRLAPGVVGFSATSHQYKYLIGYSHALRTIPGLLQIAGGIHPTIDPEGTLADTALDAVCVGEGEIPLQMLLDRIEAGGDITAAPGFFFRTVSGIKRNESPPFVRDLSSLDFPDYSVFERSFVVREWSVDNSLVIEKRDVKKYIELMLSRGCPYNCHYCCNRAQTEVYPSAHGYFRLPPPDFAVRSIKHNLRLYPEAEYIEFIDDLLIADPAWFSSFAEQYREEIALPYRICGRFELINEQTVAAMKMSGCVRVLFGLESGDEMVRKKLLNRHHTNHLIVEKCRMVMEAGITICTLNIIGFPGETKEQMEATLELNKRIRPQFGTCFFFHPYKGTELYRRCEQQGLLKTREEMMELTSNYMRPFIKLTGTDEKTCLAYQRKMSFYFFTETVRYRCRSFLEGRRGIRKLAVVLALGLMIGKAAKLYLRYYVLRKS